jgi:regulation of enolase protein 1 (concanavalin A-like superfamily)
MRHIVALALFATLAWAAHDAAEKAWETVRSKEGEFAVELPGKLNINYERTRKTAGGSVKRVVHGCKIDGVSYIAYRAFLPTAVVKEKEDEALDAERDGLAREHKGKVTSEKRLSGDRPGRDFTIRGKPTKGTGNVTVRAREYLAGDSVYVVSVVSAPDKELPEDAGRFLDSLVIGNVRVAGSAAPGPKVVSIPPWGEVFDPGKDSEVTGDKSRVRIKIHGKRKGGQTMKFTPRVMRAVEGDFTITVKVIGEFRPGGKSTNPRSIPFNGAGVLVWSDPENYIRLERAAANRDGKTSTYANFEKFEGAALKDAHNELMKAGDCWVRLERKGNTILGSVSADGTTWKQLKPYETTWPAKLKVGVAAVSSSGLPFSVTFEELEFESTKE